MTGLRLSQTNYIAESDGASVEQQLNFIYFESFI